MLKRLNNVGNFIILSPKASFTEFHTDSDSVDGGQRVAGLLVYNTNHLLSLKLNDIKLFCRDKLLSLQYEHALQKLFLACIPCGKCIMHCNKLHENNLR